MISFFSAGKTLCANVMHGLRGCKRNNIQVQKEYCSDQEAAAAAKVLNDLLSKSIEEQSKKDYLEGYRHGRSKSAKRGWHRMHLQVAE